MNRPSCVGVSMSSEAAYFPDALARTPDATEEISESADIQRDSRKTAAENAQLLDTSDEWLLERVSEGESEALGQLFRRYACVVRNIAYRILRDEAEADDLVQEVFLFVFRKVGLFDPALGSGRAWLVQVAYHRAFDRRRHLTSRRFYSNLELEEASLLAKEPAALSWAYDHTIEAAIGQDALRRIEASLSEVQRRVLQLRFFDGHTMEEIAAIIGQSAGNVRNHYYRALEKMRREVFARKPQSK